VVPSGLQFPSIRYSQRLAEIGTVPSIGTVGDSYDNALAETVNGYYKAKLIRGPSRARPWKTVEDVELATLGWVHWHNTTRLHGYLNDRPPTEFEHTFYAPKQADQTLVKTQQPEPLQNPGRFNMRYPEVLRSRSAASSIPAAVHLRHMSPDCHLWYDLRMTIKRIRQVGAVVAAVAASGAAAPSESLASCSLDPTANKPMRYNGNTGTFIRLTGSYTQGNCSPNGLSATAYSRLERRTLLGYRQTVLGRVQNWSPWSWVPIHTSESTVYGVAPGRKFTSFAQCFSTSFTFQYRTTVTVYGSNDANETASGISLPGPSSNTTTCKV
jgi:Integrase core domain